jgi:hypothetical protein
MHPEDLSAQLAFGLVYDRFGRKRLLLPGAPFICRCAYASRSSRELLLQADDKRVRLAEDPATESNELDEQQCHPPRSALA